MTARYRESEMSVFIGANPETMVWGGWGVVCVCGVVGCVWRCVRGCGGWGVQKYIVPLLLVSREGLIIRLHLHDEKPQLIFILVKL